MSRTLSSTDLSFRRAEHDDLGELQSLFVDTITAVCWEDYSPEQIKAWAASVEKTQRWNDLLNDQFVLIAEENNFIVGFASLKDGNYIDFFYVHKDHQGRGVAKRLYKEIEREAKARGANKLSSDISITAKPFFESQGFISGNKQSNNVRGVVLVNYKMTKPLTD